MSAVLHFRELVCHNYLFSSSQKLLTGVDHVVAHFFNDIVKTSGSFNHKTFEEEKKNFLLEGAKLRQLYEDNLIQPNNSVSSRSKCLCLDFIPETSSRLTVTQPDSILYGADVVLRNAEPIFITDGFSLSTIKNILNLTHHYYEGLSCPCFYVGTKHSFSTLHSKDASLWNINYLHFGLPKIWYGTYSNSELCLSLSLQTNFFGLSNEMQDYDSTPSYTVTELSFVEEWTVTRPHILLEYIGAQNSTSLHSMVTGTPHSL